MNEQRLDPASEQAIDWMVSLRSGTPNPALLERFNIWLGTDPAHALAWARLQERVGGPFNTVRALDQRHPGQAGEARQVLLQPRVSRRDALRAMAGLGLLGGAVWTGARSPLGDALLADLHTGVGQRRSFTLADGSQLSLNASSAVDVRFDERQRRIMLRRGELLIQVAPDPQRPLRVHTREGEVRALGTRFMVTQQPAASRVVVLQHSVEATLNDGTRHVLREGDTALLQAGRILALQSDQAYRADWVSGRLNVLNDPLSQVVDALRPYARGFVRVAPEVRDLRVQGVFPLDEPQRAFAALAETLPIQVDNYGPWLTLITAKQPV
jgi:transmembrane sensor